MNREQALELLPDYALGLLEPAEAAEVERLLAADPALRAELQPFLQAAEALAHGYDDAPLPAGAADRIAAGVRARLQPPAPIPFPAPAPAAPRTPWRAIALASAAAVLVLAVGLAAALIAYLDARDDADSLRAQLASRAIELPLSGDGARGAVYVSSDFSFAILRIVGLPEAPEGHHYQIWSEGPYGARSAADFEGASGELIVRLPSLPRDMTRMFVTLEPDGAAGDRPQGPEVMTSPR
ncbi:anti-sigma factor [Tepidiforma sp.]|jgi:anti-sigma-K factor RskA|uniref:anti-sigma factor n=1 Tax=Tepidiforma sp. TaxID=2682230 RepID=UPI002636CF58|nr:anti-sigma factor [Tepidiforma sp.]MCX7618297.1 anti-sigma factor [Tepidiforma sp.]